MLHSCGARMMTIIDRALTTEACIDRPMGCSSQSHSLR